MNYQIKWPDDVPAPGKLPKEIRDNWLAALRSGEYTQGRLALFAKDSYCCLGGLCKLQGRLSEFRSTEGDDILFGDACCAARLSPFNPLGFLNQEFPGEAVVNREGEVFRCLIDLNDQGFSFKEIADIIEQIWLAHE